MNYSLKVNSYGKTQYGQYVVGSIANDVILYNGIFNMAKEYALENGKIYPIKAIDIKQNKSNKINVKIELK